MNYEFKKKIASEIWFSTVDVYTIILCVIFFQQKEWTEK